MMLSIEHVYDVSMINVLLQVYETHARFALEAGDLTEYNQVTIQIV